MLFASLAFALATGQPVPLAKARLKEQLAFDVGGTPCELRVIYKELLASSETALVTCDHLTVLNRDLGQAGLLNIEMVNSSNTESVRAIVIFERGLNVTMMVLSISKGRSKITASVAYEHSSHVPAEVFEGGAIILEHVGRRFDSEEVLPSGTNVYRWQNGQYKFMKALGGSKVLHG
jgi:hypothetical protein